VASVAGLIRSGAWSGRTGVGRACPFGRVAPAGRAAARPDARAAGPEPGRHAAAV